MKKHFIFLLAIFFLLSCGKKELPKTEIYTEDVEIPAASEENISEGSDTYMYVSAFCKELKQNWEVKYYVHTNLYHTNGYVIISEVTITTEENNIVKFLFKNDPPRYYIENIHGNLEFTIGSQTYSLRGNDQNGLGFSVLRGAEDVIRAERDISPIECSWKAVLDAAARQPKSVK